MAIVVPRSADRTSDRAPSLRLVIVALLVALGLGGCRNADKKPAPIAEVDGAPITAEDFVETYVTYLINTGRNDTQANRYRHLNNLIDAYLLADEARVRGLDQDSSFQVYVERERQKALATRFYEEAFLRTLPDPTEEEMRQAFVNWKRQVVVRHLFFRSEAAAWASHRRLQAGRDFIDEAQDVYGLSAYDSTAGYLGPIRYYAVDDAFAEAAFNLDVGSYSAPVRSRHGWHVIRVEDEIRNPLLTEQEFQTRAEGLAGRERLRRRRLEGDRFVRDFMQRRDVQVEAEAVRSLQALLAELENTAPGAVRGADLRAALGDETTPAPLVPETVLATYQLDDARQSFMAGDYLFWLDSLPFAEARHRTGASVGRALRNHVLAAAAEREGLKSDPDVQRLTERVTRARLASMIRADLRNAPPPEDENLLREAYERFGIGERAQVEADYAIATFETQQEAESFRTRAETAGSITDAVGVTYVENDLLTEPSLIRQSIMRAPLETPTVVGRGDGRWSVIQVDQRRSLPVRFEDVRDELAAEVGTYLNEVELVRRLRDEASVMVDTTRFEELYDLSADVRF